MYSMVLMMALTGSADVPALGHHGCCGGCYSYSCCGGCSGGCGFCGHHHNSCCGGCYSYSCCGGCSGGCGFCGHHHHSSCCGCCGGYSCCGGCWGYSCCGGYYGCYGSCYGGVIYEGGAAPVEMAPAMAPAKEEKKEEKKPEKVPAPKGEKEEKEASLPAPATLVVSVPAQAKLSVDGYVTKSSAAVRTFTSPALENGKEYVYTLTAEVVRDGKPVRASKEITVRAGELYNVSLVLPQETVAQK